MKFTLKNKASYSKMIWVYAAGVFDLLHYGHTRFLERAKSLGDILVVGLVSDDGVKKYKHKKPILSYNERWEVIQALRSVDYIVKQDDTDPTNTLKSLKKRYGWNFNILVRGEDYKGVPPGTDFIKKCGGTVIILPYCREICSSKIKERLQQG